MSNIRNIDNDRTTYTKNGKNYNVFKIAKTFITLDENGQLSYRYVNAMGISARNLYIKETDGVFYKADTNNEDYASNVKAVNNLYFGAAFIEYDEELKKIVVVSYPADGSAEMVKTYLDSVELNERNQMTFDNLYFSTEAAAFAKEYVVTDEDGKVFNYVSPKEKASMSADGMVAVKAAWDNLVAVAAAHNISFKYDEDRCELCATNNNVSSYYSGDQGKYDVEIPSMAEPFCLRLGSVGFVGCEWYLYVDTKDESKPAEN